MKTIKATPNYSQRTFTLKVYHDDKLTSKYRTVKLDKDAFETYLYNTGNDWNQFLKSNDYYIVK